MGGRDSLAAELLIIPRMQDSETRPPGRAFAGQVVLVSGARQGIGAAIADACMMLASEAGRSISGEAIVIDGGALAR